LNAVAIYESAERPLATVIAGGGPLEEELLAQARRLGLERVWFLGDRGREDCAALYQLAELVVMPSRAEPFGLVALEAMASGTPLVGTQAGGLPEIVTDATGGLVPVDDHEMLAEMVLRAIAEDWKRTKGPAAAAYVLEHHNPEKWIARIVGIYENVLAARNAPRQPR
jgi:glycosyltransferase involved in cell wall biosynthesis